ncbi:unnamed protein product [Haemonchus placei]|uniref:DDE Tnp4 domain-containing protein n=1 Tax=Haemonchus placei TaxID=6290 RepID=A0A0N4WHI5_HAEPC|nr:unnamed protein product [Haemonchus placei]
MNDMRSEWLRRFDVLQNTIRTVNKLFKYIVDCPNKQQWLSHPATALLSPNFISKKFRHAKSTSVLVCIAVYRELGVENDRPGRVRRATVTTTGNIRKDKLLPGLILTLETASGPSCRMEPPLTGRLPSNSGARKTSPTLKNNVVIWDLGKQGRQILSMGRKASHCRDDVPPPLLRICL